MAESKLFLIVFPLTFLIFTSLISVGMGYVNGFSGSTALSQNTGTFSFGSHTISPAVSSGSFILNFLSAASIIGFIIGVLAIALVAGIQVFGSGLSNSIPWILVIIISFIVPFAVLIYTASPLLLTLPYNLGELILGLLSTMYIIGISDRLSSRGD